MTTDRDIAFPKFSSGELTALRENGTEQDTVAGQTLFAEGARDFPLFVVLAGTVEIIEHSRGTEHLVATHGPGEFVGDVDTLSGRAALVTARVTEPGRVLAIPPSSLRRVLDEQPIIGETMLKAFLMRRTLLLSEGFQGMKIIGSRFDTHAHRLRDFATRNAIPFTWLDLERDEQAESLLRDFAVPATDLPAVITPDGRLLRNPTLDDLARDIGLEGPAHAGERYDLIVIGAGPAGLAASVYAASEGLSVLALDSVAPGGQAGTSTRIENYLGFAAGITGAELTRQALLQAQKFGAQVVVPRSVQRLRLDGGDRVVVLDDGSEVRGRAILVASGVEYRRLDLPNLGDYEGAGIYYAATDMEARLCRGDEVIVVGGGNSAGQAIVFLARYARRVHVVLRGNDLGHSMSRYLVDRVESIQNVTIHKSCAVSLVAGDGHIERVQLTEADGSETTIDTSAVFLFIGATPHTHWLDGCVRLDRSGFVVTGTSLPPEVVTSDTWRAVGRAPMLLETSLPGVFAAGDVRSGSAKRVAAAVGEGAMAVSFIHMHLATLV